MLDFRSVLFELLQRDHGSEWQQLSRDLLQPTDPADYYDNEDSNDAAPSTPPAFYNLEGLLEKTRGQKGALIRPYYLVVADTLCECRARNGQFPAELIDTCTNISAITNTERIREIQQKMSQILPCDDKQELERFLFEVTNTSQLELFFCISIYMSVGKLQ